MARLLPPAASTVELRSSAEVPRSGALTRDLARGNRSGHPLRAPVQERRARNAVLTTEPSAATTTTAPVTTSLAAARAPPG